MLFFVNHPRLIRVAFAERSVGRYGGAQKREDAPDGRHTYEEFDAMTAVTSVQPYT